MDSEDIAYDKGQNVIIIISLTIEYWGNFKKMCKAKAFSKK